MSAMSGQPLNGWSGLRGVSALSGTHAYTKGECRVLLSREDRHGDGKLMWHLSISCAKRYPTWDEIKDARYSLMSHKITVAMYLPPPSEYVNLHPNCFHLWEVEK